MTTWLTDAELAQLREDIRATFPDTAVIRRVSSSISTAGYEAGTAAIIGTAIARIDPLKQSAADQFGEADKSRAFFTLSMAWNTDIRAGDNITIDGTSYEVKQAHTTHSGRAARRAIIVRLGD